MFTASMFSNPRSDRPLKLPGLGMRNWLLAMEMQAPRHPMENMLLEEALVLENYFLSGPGMYGPAKETQASYIREGTNAMYANNSGDW